MPSGSETDQRTIRWRASAAAALLGMIAWALCVPAAMAAPYSVAKRIEFHPGNPKARAMLSRIQDLRELVAEDFAVAMVDLNEDGRAEIVVQSRSSSFCGSGGCMLTVVEQQGNRMVTLLTQNLDSDLGMTTERVNGYHALAQLDASGAIAIADKRGTPLHGKQMVYPMAVAAAATPHPTTADPTPSELATTAAPASDRAASVVGIRLGMPAAEAEAALRKHAASYGGNLMSTNKYALKARCTGCNSAFDYFLRATLLIGRAPGNVKADSVSVHLSPPTNGGSRVISVTREMVLKEPVARRALIDQIVGTLGAPSVEQYPTTVWRISGGKRPVRYPDGGNSEWTCSVDPDERTSLFSQVMDDNTYARTGVSTPLNNDCGALLTLIAGGLPASPDAASSVRTILMDHAAFGRAAIAARAILEGQQADATRRVQEEINKRGAPKLN